MTLERQHLSSSMAGADQDVGGERGTSPLWHSFLSAGFTLSAAMGTPTHTRLSSLENQLARQSLLLTLDSVFTDSVDDTRAHAQHLMQGSAARIASSAAALEARGAHELWCSRGVRQSTPRP